MRVFLDRRPFRLRKRRELVPTQPGGQAFALAQHRPLNPMRDSEQMRKIAVARSLRQRVSLLFVTLERLVFVLVVGDGQLDPVIDEVPRARNGNAFLERYRKFGAVIPREKDAVKTSSIPPIPLIFNIKPPAPRPTLPLESIRTPFKSSALRGLAKIAQLCGRFCRNQAIFSPSARIFFKPSSSLSASPLSRPYPIFQ